MAAKLEQRVETLEREVAELQARQRSAASGGRGWVEELSGKFAGDPIFAQAMKLGQKYRHSLRPTGKNRAANR